MCRPLFSQAWFQKALIIPVAAGVPPDPEFCSSANPTELSIFGISWTNPTNGRCNTLSDQLAFPQ